MKVLLLLRSKFRLLIENTIYRDMKNEIEALEIMINIKDKVETKAINDLHSMRDAIEGIVKKYDVFPYTENDIISSIIESIKGVRANALERVNNGT